MLIPLGDQKPTDHLGRGGPEPPALFSPLPKPLGIYHMGLWTTFGFPHVPGSGNMTFCPWGNEEDTEHLGTVRKERALCSLPDWLLERALGPRQYGKVLAK